MSRVSKSVINLDKAKVIINDLNLEISGPCGSLLIDKLPQIKYIVENEKARVEGKNDAMAGTAIRLLRSAVLGVQKMFEKVVEIQGSGTKAVLNGNKLNLSLGYSHVITVQIPSNIQASVSTGQKSVITMQSMSSKALGDFITKIKRFRKSRAYDDFAIVVVGEIRNIKKKGGVNG